MAWQALIKDTGVWVHEYSVPVYSQVNAFAVLLDHRNLALISPPMGMNKAGFAEIEQKGHVTALLALHSGHDLGLADWQVRYPNAQSYAPAPALNQLNQTGLQPFAPLSKLSAQYVEFKKFQPT